MKKLFLLLTTLLLSTGMWAESVTFTTYRKYAPVYSDWVNNQRNTELNNLKNDYAVQSNPYVKIDTKNPNVTYDWGNLATDGAGDFTMPYNYYLWLQTNKVEVSLLDAYAEIESITVTYTTTTESTEIGLNVKSSTFTMPFPAGQTSHLFTFTQGSIRVMSITVNYRSNRVNGVAYIDENGDQQTRDNVTGIHDFAEQVILTEGWYVVKNDVTLSRGAVCNGAVHLILADGAKLTAKGRPSDPGDSDYPGIQVSGADNSLTIYGQENQTGQLIAQGGRKCAGIGGEDGENGSNITINGGVISADGGRHAAGIGGGEYRSGTNITINRGTVTASGGSYAAGIGGGMSASASNIRINGGTITAEGGDDGGDGTFPPGIGSGVSGTATNIYVSTSCILKADDNNPPTTIITNDGADLASSLVGKRYATIEAVAPMTVTLDMQGGNGGTASVTAIYGSAMPAITLPTRTGYAFQGYFSEAEGAGTQYYNADGTSAHVWDQTEAKTLYAHWTANTYTITFDMQDGEGGTASVTATYDAAMPAITLPTRSGYAFSGYFSETEGTGTQYYNADGTSAQVCDFVEAKTLYAHWTANTYTITFDMQDGEGGTTSVTTIYGAAMPEITLPTRTGYAFQGYFSETNGAGTQYYNADGTSAHVWDQAEAKTLYADWAPLRVDYIDADGSAKFVTEFTLITNSSTTLDAGWYVVYGADVRTGMLTCNGDVHLILVDGAKLTATGGGEAAGIQVSGENNSLTIYGQTAQSGQLVAQGGYWGAGIGGGNWASASNITINGGIVTATGGIYAAGIGGGDSGAGSNITINAGTVTATGGYDAAGIGGGVDGAGHDITINGGTVTATGGPGGAGIGGGWRGSASDVFIHSSLALYADNITPPTAPITHTTDEDVAESLAGKQYVSIRKAVTGLTITLDKQGGTGGIDQVTANEGEDMPTLSSLPTRDNFVFGGYCSAPNGEGMKYYHADGTSANRWNQTEDKTLYAYWLIPNVPYVDADGTPHTANAAKITNTTATLHTGWYVVLDAEVETAGLVCDGAVNLILADGAKLTATGEGDNAGVQVSGENNSLTIYAQTAQSGQLVANGGFWGAGIGGGYYHGAASNITINGGKVTATGGYDGAGIGGGGYEGAGSNITINAGTVTATGGEYGAGIGGGRSGAGSNITINGGVVTATGGEYGAGIGGGNEGTGTNITIHGGTVTATGGEDGAGIGGGDDGTGSDITIHGGTVTATGGGSAAGIGGGESGAGSNITINGGVVTATGGSGEYSGGAGIGGGYYHGAASNITINGGTVTATGGSGEDGGGAGIGSGYYYGAASNITINGGEVTATGGDYAAGIGSGYYYGAASNITINGGEVTATGGDYAAGIGGGCYGNGSYITISGGVITATGGEYGAGIGSGYYADDPSSNIFVSDLLILKAGDTEDPTEVIAHTSTQDLVEVLADKRYATIETTAITVITHYAANMQANYGTFYNSASAYEVLTEGVTFYTVSLVTYGSETYLNLSEINGTILPAGTPVIIRSESETAVLLNPYTGSTADVVVPDNSLSGTDVNLTVAANTVYTLAAEDGVMAFYTFAGTKIPAHKAYLELAPGMPAPRRIAFGGQVVTGTEHTAVDLRVEKMVRNGQLLILKDGILYNIQGAVVK